MKRLYLFTATYPYDGAETFLEDEILFLKEVFDSITIIPMNGVILTRNVPTGCEVLSPVERIGFRRYFNIFIPNKASIPYIREFFKKRVYTSLTRIKKWLISYRVTCNLIRDKRIQSILKKLTSEDVCYSYWGGGEIALVSLFYKSNAKFISRFHGEWDLWEESSGGYSPYRDRIAEKLDLAAFISQKGLDYFVHKYYTKRAAVFPLGSFDKGVCEKSRDGVLRVVSCSSVYPLKRVPLIFESLNSSSLTIEWTHIGGGVQFDELRKIINDNKRDGLIVNLTGQLSHDNVTSFYQSHHVDLFINLSTNEGVPVSIMEAISFDIPVIATNVGATSEIVCDETGILLDENPSPKDVTDAIESIYNNIGTIHPRVFWQNHYNADNNYKLFANTIASLS